MALKISKYSFSVRKYIQFFYFCSDRKAFAVNVKWVKLEIYKKTPEG